MTRISFFFMMASFISCAQPSPQFETEQLLGKKEISLAGDGYQLLPQAADAFEQMKAAAKKEGIKIKAVSSFRSYQRQRAIWNRKYKANAKAGLSPQKNIQKIIQYSTIPGTSRHHWGTEIDIVDGAIPPEGDVLLTRKFHNSGPYEPLRKWLEAHAQDYGFICAYPDDSERPGFSYEPWHYSYAPLSQPLYKAYLKLDLKEALSDLDMEGSNHLDQAFLMAYRESHVKGINPALK